MSSEQKLFFVGANSCLFELEKQQEEHNYFENVPDEIVCHIFSFIPKCYKVFFVRYVCKRFGRIIGNKQFRRGKLYKKCIKYFSPDLIKKKLKYVKYFDFEENMSFAMRYGCVDSLAIKYGRVDILNWFYKEGIFFENMQQHQKTFSCKDYNYKQLDKEQKNILSRSQEELQIFKCAYEYGSFKIIYWLKSLVCPNCFKNCMPLNGFLKIKKESVTEEIFNLIIKFDPVLEKIRNMDHSKLVNISKIRGLSQEGTREELAERFEKSMIKEYYCTDEEERTASRLHFIYTDKL